MRCIKVFVGLCLASSLLPMAFASGGAAADSECSQPAAERDALIREAETDQYTTRRLEFLGTRYTRDAVLRRKTIIGLQEGEVFTRYNLIRSLRNVSTVKTLYPVKLKDIEVQLDRANKTIDLLICFKERPRSKRT
jgi:outer membrane protein assembly factor BamA